MAFAILEMSPSNCLQYVGTYENSLTIALFFEIELNFEKLLFPKFGFSAYRNSLSNKFLNTTRALRTRSLLDIVKCYESLGEKGNLRIFENCRRLSRKLARFKVDVSG